MKNYVIFFFLFYSSLVCSQNISVDNNTYTPQQLIEDILINSDCITDVVVTNVIGGDFGATDQSFGFFDATGTTFPIQSGIVLSTGRLANVPGPNSNLSDDDAPGWSGDNDLETVLNESNTHNATIIEFEFVSISNQISFRYLFASEEYQEGNSNTCQYSDLFGFLIRPASETRYDNIAVVPGTRTPVKVTTVHSGIPGSCDPINEEYFGSWNDTSAPINFNGQTTVLTATAQIIPNETYHVKLVIADEQNYRYDSAVFLEAGSFLPDVNLGENRLISTYNPLCENETLELDATQTGATSYTWFKNSLPLVGETNPTYTVVDEGIYEVVVDYPINCTATGIITVEYSLKPIVTNATLISCDFDQDGITTYFLFNAESNVTTSGSDFISSFHTSFADADQNIDAINNPANYENSSTMQTVFARVKNLFGCFSIAEVLLDISNNVVTIPPFKVCDDFPVDGYSHFDLDELRSEIELLVPAGSTIRFFPNENDMISELNSIDGNYPNMIQHSETIYALIKNGTDCYATTTVILTMEITPELEEDETTYYCTNTYPDTIILNAGILSGLPEDFTYEWTLNSTLLSFNTASINTNETGIYTVTVTHPSGCFSSRTITVEPSTIAIIDGITVSGVAPNNEVTILVSGSGEYEYAIEAVNLEYQEHNIFTNVPAGEYTVYVRDKNGCGIVEDIVYVLGFPSYFTPNGDNRHETWKPLGVDSRFTNNMTIQIFNRYGKYLKQINPQGEGWNGTFNNEKLPVDDYWYVVTFSDGKSYRGHFSLKR